MNTFAECIAVLFIGLFGEKEMEMEGVDTTPEKKTKKKKKGSRGTEYAESLQKLTEEADASAAYEGEPVAPAGV